MQVHTPYTLKNLLTYEEGTVNKKVLLKNEKSLTILFALGKDALLEEHTAPGDALVLVLEGEALFTIEGKDVSLEEGESLLLEKGVLHAVRAKKPMVFLITIAK